MRADDPYRDRGCWLHMMALYQAGRCAEALDVFTAYSAQLADDLGLEAGQNLRDLQSAILRHEPELATWPHPTASAATAERAQPKTGPAVGPRDRRIRLVGRHREISTVAEILDGTLAGASRWLLLTAGNR